MAAPPPLPEPDHIPPRASISAKQLTAPTTQHDLLEMMIGYLLENLQPYLWTRKSNTIKHFEDFYFSTSAASEESVGVGDVSDILIGRGGKGRGLLETVSNANWANGQLKPSAAASVKLLLRFLNPEENACASKFANFFKTVEARHLESMHLGKHVNGKGGDREGSLRLIRFLREHRPDVKIVIETPKSHSGGVVGSDDARMKRRSSIFQQLNAQVGSPPARSSNVSRRMSVTSAYQDLVERNILKSAKKGPAPHAATLPTRMSSLKKFFSFEKPKGTSTLVFGVPLKDCFQQMRSTGQMDSPAPTIVVECCEHIERHGKKYVGIFRLPGNGRHVRETKALLDTGMTVDFSSLNIHVVTSLLKLWFRELPDPVLSFALYGAITKAFKRKETEDIQRQQLKKVLDSLSRDARSVTAYLCYFLHRLAQSHEQHKMTAKNLAMVFGPNLLRPKEEDYQTLLEDTPVVMAVVTALILAPEFFFPEFEHFAEEAPPELPPEEPEDKDEDTNAVEEEKAGPERAPYHSRLRAQSSFGGDVNFMTATPGQTHARASSGNPMFASDFGRARSASTLPATAPGASAVARAEFERFREEMAEDSIFEVEADAAEDAGGSAGRSASFGLRQSRPSIVDSMDAMIDQMFQ